MTAIAVTATPGVYIVEQDAFPASVVAVETAIPAFIGYTERADYQGKTLVMKPTLITSLQDYLTYYGNLDANGNPLPAGSQYEPVYHAVPSSGAGDVTLGGTAYDVLPDPTTIYYLYNSIRMFYANGGGNAYVVSVGVISNTPGGKPIAAGAPLVNPRVNLNDFTAALTKLEDEQDPTMLLVPDGNLLDEGDYSTLMETMLNQCGELGSRVALLDIPAGLAPDPMQWRNDITAFRTDTGMNFLEYGMAYYPFLQTTTVQAGDFDYDNCGGAAELKKLLPEASNADCATVLGMAAKPAPGNPSSSALDSSLQQLSPSYANLKQHVIDLANTLPPAPAMAGVYTMVDNNNGVWKAPANVSLTGVTNTTLKLSDSTQANLNVDALTGKSINAVRLFTGKGVLVWGARTLAGNDDNWRYINVRRTMIMIEQSIKLAAAAYVFEANDANTWSTVGSMISNFLASIWVQGGLAGASPGDAFTVAVGLGKTMTAQDILDGKMNINVTVALTHPAEFIVITYTQQMQKS